MPEMLSPSIGRSNSSAEVLADTVQNSKSNKSGVACFKLKKVDLVSAIAAFLGIEH